MSQPTNTVKVLSEKVASQIAAGEVVDRPASVVRELLDNSIDAGAQRILIRIEEGGKKLVKVSDNGIGMGKEDLLLCVERHATSKIQALEDLFFAGTLGFRGEALPSIGAVSRMQIISRPAEAVGGHSLRISGGKVEGVQEAGSPAGTIVEVRDLFFNVPARRKFLRAERTETGHIIDVISRLSLAFPDIGFKLEEGDKAVLNLPGNEDLSTRVFRTMGREVSESLTEIKEEREDVSVLAYLAPPELSRSRGDRLFVYVNGRNVRDRLINSAVFEGYGQRLMKGRYPQGLVFIDVDPTAMDVNVHPTKQEIRFQDPGKVYRCILSAIERKLSGFSSGVQEVEREVKRPGDSQAETPFFLSEPASSYLRELERDVRDGQVISLPREQERAGEDLRVIGQLGYTYILCESSQGLLLIDQHAAHERIVYENLKNALDSGGIESQGLLVPMKLEFAPKEARILQEKVSGLRDYGIILEHFGGNTFLLQSVPALLSQNIQWETFINELLPQLEKGGLHQVDSIDELLKVMACHGSVRAGQKLTGEEMEHLIKDLNAAALPTNCPHGRPVFRHLTYYELEKMFKRVVH